MRLHMFLGVLECMQIQDGGNSVIGGTLEVVVRISKLLYKFII